MGIQFRAGLHKLPFKRSSRGVDTVGLPSRRTSKVESDERPLVGRGNVQCWTKLNLFLSPERRWEKAFANSFLLLCRRRMAPERASCLLRSRRHRNHFGCSFAIMQVFNNIEKI